MRRRAGKPRTATAAAAARHLSACWVPWGVVLFVQLPVPSQTATRLLLLCVTPQPRTNVIQAHTRTFRLAPSEQFSAEGLSTRSSSAENLCVEPSANETSSTLTQQRRGDSTQWFVVCDKRVFRGTVGRVGQPSGGGRDRSSRSSCCWW